MTNNTNNSKNNHWKKFLRNNGYYMVLILCVAAVGVSGYLFINTATGLVNNQVEETLSVPLTPETTTPEEPDGGATPTVGTSEPVTEPVEPNQPITLPAEPAAPTVTVYPVTGEVLAVFSLDELAYNETTRDWRTHGGIDLACDTGAYVMVAQNGTVTAVRNDKSLGWTVVVNHGDGLETSYSNLAEEMVVSVGDEVTAGEAIGTVGGTAITEVAQAPHVHFAVYQDSIAVNPEEFLAANS